MADQATGLVLVRGGSSPEPEPAASDQTFRILAEAAVAGTGFAEADVPGIANYPLFGEGSLGIDLVPNFIAALQTAGADDDKLCRVIGLMAAIDELALEKPLRVIGRLKASADKLDPPITDITDGELAFLVSYLEVARGITADPKEEPRAPKKDPPRDRLEPEKGPDEKPERDDRDKRKRRERPEKDANADPDDIVELLRGLGIKDDRLFERIRRARTRDRDSEREPPRQPPPTHFRPVATDPSAVDGWPAIRAKLEVLFTEHEAGDKAAFAKIRAVRSEVPEWLKASTLAHAYILERGMNPACVNDPLFVARFGPAPTPSTASPST